MLGDVCTCMCVAEIEGERENVRKSNDVSVSFFTINITSLLNSLKLKTFSFTKHSFNLSKQVCNVYHETIYKNKVFFKHKKLKNETVTD